MSKATAPDRRHYEPAKKACQSRGIPYSTVRAAVLRDELKVLRLGSPDSQRKAWYLDSAELDSWLTAQVAST